MGTWDDIEDVYVSFKIDGWKPIKMKKMWDSESVNSKDGKKTNPRNGYCSFQLVRMLPPGRIFFCFSLKFDGNNLEENVVPAQLPCLSSDYGVWDHKENVFQKCATLPQCKHQFFKSELSKLESVEKAFCPKCNVPFRYEDLNFQESLHLNSTNFIALQKRVGPLVPTRQFPRMSLEEIETGSQNKLTRTGFVRFNISRSIFASRAMESTTFNLLNNSDIYDDCSKIDFQSFRLLDDVKDEGQRQMIFDCVQSYYFELIDVFTYNALKSTSPTLFAMDLSSVISWYHDLELLDNQYSEENVRALWKKAQQYGEVASVGCICRKHFIALLVRIAVDRFHTHGEESSPVDAVRHCLINVVFKNSFVPNINGDEFRQTKLYTSGSDNLLKRYYLDIKKIFEMYSTTVTTCHGSEHHIITCESAMELARHMSLLDVQDNTDKGVNRFHERMENIRIAYVSSLLLIDDEERVDSVLRHSLSLIGFLEYLSRLALLDKLDLRLEKERVVVKGKRHGNIVAANFYQLDYIDKLERFLKVYVVHFVSKRTSGN